MDTLIFLALLAGVSLALVIALYVRWLVSRRLGYLEQRIAEVAAERQEARVIRQLVERVYALETATRGLPPGPVAVAPDIAPPIPVETPPPKPVTLEPEPDRPSLSDRVCEHVDRSEVAQDIAPLIPPEAPAPVETPPPDARHARARTRPSDLE